MSRNFKKHNGPEEKDPQIYRHQPFGWADPVSELQPTASTAIGVDSLALAYTNTLVAKADTYLKARQPDTQIEVRKARVSNKDNIDAAPQFNMKYSLHEKEEETPPEPGQESASGDSRRGRKTWCSAHTKPLPAGEMLDSGIPAG